MVTRTAVMVAADDPISESGIMTHLRGRPRCRVVAGVDSDQADVAVVVVDTIDDSACQTIRATQRNGVPRVVVVAGGLDEAGLPWTPGRAVPGH